ncbi:MAG TPA: (4Fe-4S)-binding protein [Acidimicrobiales bacterium]|nr:(4Fe-4S)-binding protein [Acidimicrobiales bacterium]
MTTEPDSPDEAGRPATKGPTRTYETDGIRVLWDASLCTHAAECTRSLPHVFNPMARPWIDVTAAPADEIRRAVDRCPTGALAYESGEGGPQAQVVIDAQPNGPLFVRGAVQISDGSHGVVATGSRFALCRCGRSQNKPFCDNSHRSDR